MLQLIKQNSLYFAWAVAVLATLGSLYFSEIAGFVPCVLCWYQRLFMFPLAITLTVGILRADPKVHLYVLPLALAGTAIGFYQTLLQYGVIAENLAPCVAGISCTTRYINWFGFVTIPLLSLFSFLTIVTLMFLYTKQKNDIAE